MANMNGFADLGIVDVCLRLMLAALALTKWWLIA